MLLFSLTVCSATRIRYLQVRILKELKRNESDARKRAREKWSVDDDVNDETSG